MVTISTSELVQVTDLTTEQLVALMRYYRRRGNGHARVEARPGLEHPMVRGVEWRPNESVPPGYLRVEVVGATGVPA
jgi:hypothetical protein